MTEFYKGSTPCVVGQTSYQVIHPKINDPLSYPVVSLVLPNGATGTPIAIKGIKNKSTVSFDVVLTAAPSVTGYAINWQINIPGTDVAEYVNDKRYYSKEEIGNAKLARVHWKNVISAPDLSTDGLQKSHNHNNIYYTKSEIVPVIDARITDNGSYAPLANTLMLRDSSGRCQVNNPKVNVDSANKGYVDVKVAGEASARVAGDMFLQSEVTAISGTYTPLTETQILQARIEYLEAMVMDISAIGFYTGGSVPVGAIIGFPDEVLLGVDWSPLDGGLLSVSGHPELFGIIGYKFGGSGDYFAKPDSRGEFFRGADEGRGIDPGRTIGSYQSGSIESHAHSTTVNTAGAHNHTVNVSVDGNHAHAATIDNAGSHSHGLIPPLLDESGNSIQGQDSPGDADPISATQPAGDHNHTITINATGDHSHVVALDPDGGHAHSVTVLSTGSAETRPRNLALKYYIKVLTPKILEPVNTSTSQSISGQKIFTEAMVVAPIPQAIIFGDPNAVGTKALGIIGNNMVVTVHVSGNVWTPVTWLT